VKNLKPTFLKLTQESYNVYRESVKGNEDITLDQAARKVSRNCHYVRDKEKGKVVKNGWFTTTYSYGNLDIVVRWGKVLSISNKKGNGVTMNIDRKYYNELSSLYGVEPKHNKFRHKSKLHTYAKGIK
jgi:hypothetical protein